ncbi:hypothetical protein PSAB6_160040 [Paraburkholderia sabiae]|nr:hypothetical protein PSAB6_160040 [Paraburkholderia sabiae]
MPDTYAAMPAETRCLLEPAPCSGPKVSSIVVSPRRHTGKHLPVPTLGSTDYSGTAASPAACLLAFSGPPAGLAQTNSPCLNHASLNAHIEWRFP